MFIQDDTFNNFPKMYTRHDYYSASTIRDTRVIDLGGVVLLENEFNTGDLVATKIYYWRRQFWHFWLLTWKFVWFLKLYA